MFVLYELQLRNTWRHSLPSGVESLISLSKFQSCYIRF